MSEHTPRTMVGVDIGGTFTDVILLGEEELTRRKVLSSPHDYSAAVQAGIVATCEGQGAAPGDVVDRVVHATTVVTNAILENKGVRTALITTRGFRDVLQFGRLRRPSLYDLGWERPAPLVRRALRAEVTERVDASGQVLAPLDEEEARRIVRRLDDDAVEAVAVCLLNSYVNPVHEQRLGELIAAEAPGLHVSLSSDILPRIKEYERTSTTVVDAYVAPLFKEYVGALEQRLEELGVDAPLLLMQSNGGIVPASVAVNRSVAMVESGPAAGALGVAMLSSHMGRRDMIGLDIGGTTAKACLIEDGKARETQEFEVGAGINVESRLLTGGGYAVALPSVDLAEIGAGGGSIARVDVGGALKVGPDSAGASPGPVCYGLGGTEPTITDAFAVLGFLGDEGIAGGEQTIDVDAACAAVADRIARPLGYGLEEAAWGIFRVGTATMTRAVRAVTTERGRDPRTMEMVAFGGAGPAHGAELARQLGVKRVIVPPLPGVFSSLGLLLAELRFDFIRPTMRRSSVLADDELAAGFAALEDEGRSFLRSIGVDPAEATLELMIDARYEGQSSELSADVTRDATVKEVTEAFAHEHERTYGHRSVGDDESVFLTSVRLRIRAPGSRAGYERVTGLLRQETDRELGERRVYFGREHGWVPTPVITRAALDDAVLPGPLIVQEYDSTIVVPPDSSADLDDLGNLVIALGS